VDSKGTTSLVIGNDNVNVSAVSEALCTFIVTTKS